ncbi:hypothetical protein J3458_001013 [Metarhizium acridum]|uniref:uncharacterized protein n=1 Tax=Metarhizium acridum TaxID=92637 RepID=UPI001C6ACE41|nr:hypothetical protein J3458_001013 [Metarhizium acridum]
MAKCMHTPAEGSVCTRYPAFYHNIYDSWLNTSSHFLGSRPDTFSPLYTYCEQVSRWMSTQDPCSIVTRPPPPAASHRDLDDYPKQEHEWFQCWILFLVCLRVTAAWAAFLRHSRTRFKPYSSADAIPRLRILHILDQPVMVKAESLDIKQTYGRTVD